jgi:tetratricopeptide (TPR) repeat protein
MLEQGRIYWKPISLCVAAVMVVVVGVIVFRFFSDRAEDKAFALLNETLVRYTSERSGQDAQKALAAVAPDFEKLFADFGDRQGGLAGRLIFAQMNLEANRPEVAAEHYKTAVEKFSEGSFALSAALSGWGYALAASGQHEKAIAAFTKVVDGNDPALKADALYQVALLYQKTGQEAKYNQALQTLREEHATFMYAEMLTAPADG